jgi:hypothetical protein
MTTNTTTDPGPEASDDLAIEHPIASEIPSEVAVPLATSELDLESRIRERRAELIGRLRELKRDLRIEASEARHKLKARLSELAHIVEWAIVDGWASIGVPVTHKLEQWLTESARQLATKNEQP